MKTWIKYGATGLFVAVFVTGMCFLNHFSREEDSHIVCTGLDVVFRDSLHFVSKDDIMGYLNNDYGCYLGQQLDSVSLSGMESILNSRSAILKSEAWTTPDGVVHIAVTQRKPILRFMNGERGFYVDNEGFIFPLHPDYTAPVTVISGSIPVSTPSSSFKGEAGSSEEQLWIKKMLEFNKIVLTSKLWNGKLSSISVDANGDICLKMESCSETFIFGPPTDMEDKFGRMEKYFSHILPSVGADHYKTVNVKYKGQIICRTTDI